MPDYRHGRTQSVVCWRFADLGSAWVRLLLNLHLSSVENEVQSVSLVPETLANSRQLY